MIYGPEGKTHLFPSDVEALANVNGLLDQVARNRIAVVNNANAELLSLNGTSQSYLTRFPSNVESDFKQAFGRSQRLYSTGDADRQIDVFDAIKTVLTTSPEHAVRDEMYLWASRFFHSNLIVKSGALKNIYQGNSSIQFIYDRFVQLERIFEIDDLNTFRNAIPERI